MHASLRLLRHAGKGNIFSFYYRCVQFSPHPDKQETGGEDAFLSLLGVQAVLDGVSWWKEHRTVDAGLYSAALARAMHAYVEEELMGENPASSLDVLQHAYDVCKTEEIEGTATALVATLQPLREEEVATANKSGNSSNSVLDICSLGDCTAVLVRRGRVVFVSSEQTHDLDFPYQLGKGSGDTPSRALNYRIPVEAGDMLLLGSDGVFDNLYPVRVADIVWSPVNRVRMEHNVDSGSTAWRNKPLLFYESMMHAIATGSEDALREARCAARDLHADTPYAHKAVEGGAYYEGGKQDDMTLLVSIIDEECEMGTGERIIRSTVMNPYPYRDWP
ncbi:protein phosphatase 2C [Trypanosoma theileri]|uniref:Protein phosphatase n=1 Tax=Trypanosoma theileri TaxID=67003 RepID=A0A1X0P4F0_9TRYP|nr:protein phosphatase 2C [Trypanosoma theileri]ORC91708.1 protein phosphatase 2C [Trypanosoma theileri]